MVDWDAATNGRSTYGTFGTSTGWTLSWSPPPPSDDPRLQGSGPPECSSCTELSVQPAHIWDVNGYYRDLGVPTDATRKQMRLAYQAQDGPNDKRLTYVFKQLLNPETRRLYDLTPLGELFMDDYVREILNRIAKARMSERMAAMAAAGALPSEADEEAMMGDIYGQMGFEVQDPDTPSEMVDQGAPEGEDDHRPAKFEYSYYLWRTRLREDPLTLRTLALWQRYLVSALAREGVKIKFAVGYHGEPNRWIQATVGYRTVFFLSTGHAPTEDLAADVARQVKKDSTTSLAIRR